MYIFLKTIIDWVTWVVNNRIKEYWGISVALISKQ